MLRIERIAHSSSFKRAFKKRVQGTPDEAALWRRLRDFVNNPNDPRLGVHKLAGKLQKAWALDVSYDCRVVFVFTSDTEILLVDVGSHDEVY